MRIEPIGATLPGLSHHRLQLDEAALHYVSAGTSGTGILLVHGFPETWWTFHKLIPLLAERHRVFAVDLRGFGDSNNGPGVYDSRSMAEDLHRLIAHLDIGPVHVTGQDISGASVFRLAATHTADIRSLIAIEMGLAGFGLEALADVTQGGAWHIGMLAAPGIAEMLLPGRERVFIEAVAFRALSADPLAITEADLAEFARTYARPDGWRGASGLYRSMLQEGEDLRALAMSGALSAPVLAIGAGGGSFTADTMAAAAKDVRRVLLEGVGHYAALESPEALASAILAFAAEIDAV